MPQAPLSNERLQEIIATWESCDRNVTKAADMLGVAHSTMRGYLAMWKHRSERLLNEEAQQVGFPAEGTTNYWVKTKDGSYHVKRPPSTIDDIKEHFEALKTQAHKCNAPKHTDADCLTLYPLADLHLGLLSWGRETGKDWDLPIALAQYRSAMERLSLASPASQTAIVLGGGDLLHSDSFKPLTPISANLLDVDGRFPKALKAAIDLLVFQVDLARQKHADVIVRILPGNHDVTSAIAVMFALDAWYRNEPRVTVDTDPGLFWFYGFGKTMLGATHGHAAKLADMPLIMANRAPEAWAASRHRFIHGFHLHHKQKYAWEGGGVVGEIHQSPAAQDAYHHGKGYLSNRTMCSITYHRENGEIARSQVALS
jgi:hypothetical protein